MTKWTPEQVDATVSLAQVNFQEGESKVRRAVKAVYERKRRIRLEAEQRKWLKEMARLWMEEETHHGLNKRLFGYEFD